MTASPSLVPSWLVAGFLQANCKSYCANIHKQLQDCDFSESLSNFPTRLKGALMQAGPGISSVIDSRTHTWFLIPNTLPHETNSSPMKIGRAESLPTIHIQVQKMLQ